MRLTQGCSNKYHTQIIIRSKHNGNVTVPFCLHTFLLVQSGKPLSSDAQLLVTPHDLQVTWPTSHMTYKLHVLQVTWPTCHMTYKSHDLQVTWPTSHMTYKLHDLEVLHVIWPASHRIVSHDPLTMPHPEKVWALGIFSHGVLHTPHLSHALGSKNYRQWEFKCPPQCMGYIGELVECHTNCIVD